MILLFAAGAATELIVYLWMRLVAEKKPRRLPLLAITACEYALWGLVVRQIVVEGWTSIVVYALGGMCGVLAGTFLPSKHS